jgi:hypothetical protein
LIRIHNPKSLKGLLRRADDGRLVVDVSAELAVTVVKSDGSSLYMTRDIAAALDRRRRYGDFERMFYVVDNSQSIHFSNLFYILDKVNYLVVLSLEPYWKYSHRYRYRFVLCTVTSIVFRNTGIVYYQLSFLVLKSAVILSFS